MGGDNMGGCYNMGGGLVWVVLLWCVSIMVHWLWWYYVCCIENYS